MTDDPEYELIIDPEHARPGYSCLAYEEDGSYIVNGVAIGNGDVTQGMSGKETVWPADVLEEAADLLVGTPITAGQLDDKHPGAERDETGLSVAAEAPDEAIIGQVTQARWDDALGLLWQGEITDESVADGVERGDIDVSPVISRDVEQVDEGQWEATAIHGFRDLTALPPSIPGAAPSNSINSGVAEALAAAFDEPADTGTDADDSDTKSDTTMTEYDLTEKEVELLSLIRQADEPAVIESEDADKLPKAESLLSEADAIEGEPKMVAAADYDALQSHVTTIEEMANEALVAQRGLKEATVEAMSFDAKVSEFETEDGSLDAEALVQSPETGDVTEEEAEETESGVEALTDDERADVELCVTQARRMESLAPDFAEEKRLEAAEALSLDVEDGAPALDEIESAL